MENQSSIEFDPRVVFSPKRALRAGKQQLFAGRSKLVADFLDAIALEGASACIYGDPGVGKTSFAWQCLEILSGNIKSLEVYGATPRFPVNKYRCIWLECHPGLVDIEDVLLALLTDQDSPRTLHSEFPNVMHDADVRDEVKRTYEFNLGLAKVKFNVAGKRDSNPEQVSSQMIERRQRVHGLFRSVLRKALKVSENQEIIFFIDEFNKISNKSGIGQLIKVTGECRFVLVGIADDVGEIIDDEASAGRKLEGSKFPISRLDHIETLDLLARAERIYPKILTFSDQFKSRIWDESEGYPWLIQLLGYNSVLKYTHVASERHPVVVSEADLQTATEILAGPQGDVDRFERLVRAVSDSQNIEAILFKLAEQSQGWTFKATLKEIVPSNARLHFDPRIKNLVSAGVLKSDGKGRVRFVDPVYRAIVRFASHRPGGLRTPKS